MNMLIKQIELSATTIVGSQKLQRVSREKLTDITDRVQICHLKLQQMFLIAYPDQKATSDQ